MGPTFSRGGGGGVGRVQLFPGGGQMLISIETHITCDFPGGSEPLSPLWIRTWPKIESWSLPKSLSKNSVIHS